jgi:hypothetical protein
MGKKDEAESVTGKAGSKEGWRGGGGVELLILQNSELSSIHEIGKIGHKYVGT